MRTITSDHNHFDECIEAFRPSGQTLQNFMGMPGTSYLLTDFELVNEWDLPNAIVSASQKIDLSGLNAAFVSQVIQKDGGIIFGHQFFSTALAAIVAFATGRVCKSPRDDFSEFTGIPYEAIELALLHPVRVGGPGAVAASLSKSSLNSKYNSVCNLIRKLLSMEHSLYVKSMQAMRLLHLALINKKEDFGLSYLLTVSAIEAISQHAIKKKKFKIKHRLYTRWGELAAENSEVSELFEEYKKADSKDYLTERYIKFIETYCPVSSWESIVPIPNQEAMDRDREKRKSYGWNIPADYSRPTRSPFEIYPSDLEPHEITEILKSSYKYRSQFVHVGRQPPHKSPISNNRFFDERVNNYDIDNFLKSQTEILPNLELMAAIARTSITNWINSNSMSN
ncbi:hypothetical protein [Pseudomonas juntendi]|uniref:hypothetical protein n=1 Tax=Pseudomonas juntendi TaxID=2666183 RepID=UPI001F1A01CE|nr:hypothetical protein [Pseudomonas juntendi]